ncbi:hypothetical protein [Nesterenkonia alkaliphila]|uniref:Uncharacterized protein n=1 Tax=Nesterenkonia alkaliphila TaxID=1463631 RepID=A0A7K1UIE6_9MICC|nr:hypothetical protein [Nesterenkonia alkaliphila]MVT26245.1 hypothetical protein [Nesterenkonia alkaliphila]GFZ99459.1 hypothetical protein GCM10011359_30540 [Nesterenkonia alkaliphila]
MSDQRSETGTTQAESKADRLYRQAWGDPRPKPDFTMDPVHLFLLVASVLTAVGTTVLSLLNPSEAALWVVGGVMLLVLGMAWLSFKPHWLNYPYMIEPENAQRAYRVGQQMMVQSTAAATVCLLGTASSWFGWGLGWLLPVGSALLIGACIAGIIRCFRAR